MTIFANQTESTPEESFLKEMEADTSAPEAPAEPVEEAEASEPAPKAEAKEMSTEPAQTQERDTGEEADKQGKIPYGALKAAREENRGLVRKLGQLEGLVHSIMHNRQQQEQRAPQADPLDVDENVDPLQAIAAIRAEAREIRATIQQNQQQATLKSAYTDDARMFVAQTPDFKEAYNHLITSRAAELQALGHSPQNIPQLLEQEEISLAQMAFQQGRRPAEVLYQYAKARGYSKAAPAPAPIAPEKIVEQIEAKQAAGTSISSGGKPPENPVTIDDGVNLKGAAFDSWFENQFRPKESRGEGLFRN